MIRCIIATESSERNTCFARSVVHSAFKNNTSGKKDTSGKSAEGSKIQSESKAATTRGGSNFERMEPS